MIQRDTFGAFVIGDLEAPAMEASGLLDLCGHTDIDVFNKDRTYAHIWISFRDMYFFIAGQELAICISADTLPREGKVVAT